MTELKDEPFALIGVNADPDLDRLREIVAEKNINWRSFWNGEEGPRGPIARAWGVSSWPTMYLIDARGRIRHTSLHGEEEITRAVHELLAEARDGKPIESPSGL